MQNQIKILGFLSIMLGIIAAVVWIFPYGYFIALPIGFLGTIVSILYIYTDMKYEINTKKITPGIIGIILSSIPILLVLAMIIIGNLKK